MNAHTKGPWHKGFFVGDGFNICCSSDGRVVGAIRTTEDRRRIVACVNACEGISTEILEHFGQMVVEGALTNRQLSTQHDKLLDVVRMLIDWSARYPPDGIYSENAIRRIAAEMKAINTEAISALAKIEPKQQQKETQHA